MKITRLTFPLALLLVWAGAAQATIIGVAVDGIATNNDVGSVNPDGSINFFAPLSEGASGTYGVDAGMTADTCYYPSTCTGGTLDIFLRFDPVPVGDALLSLSFLDLDLAGANDPWFFFESLTLANSSGDTLFSVDSIADGTSDLAILANNSVQFLFSFIDVATDPLFLQLTIGTDFSAFTPSGWYRNTSETMLASLTPVSVPEPATLSLLGAGLVVVGFAKRRKGAKTA